MGRSDPAASGYIVDGSCTRSKRMAAWPSGVGGVATAGIGPYVITDDGRQLIDWVGSLGATPLGYTHPRIQDAISVQLRRGTIYSYPSVLEERVAAELAAVIPGADRFKFFKTGSESTAAAVAIARAATGRDHVIVDSRAYHGWHDWSRGAAAMHPGVPEAVCRLLIPWPKSDDLTEITAWDDIAAVVVEPPRYRRVHQAWFTEIHAIARQHGALVIHDNMIWGGRHALAGADEYYRAIPDLSCFGKAFGAGLPLAFVCGRADLMRYGWVASGTFSGDALALAACSAMLQVYRDEAVIAHLWRNGQAAWEAIQQAAADYAVAVTIIGYPPHFTLRFERDHRRQMSIFCQRMAARQILWHPMVTNSSAAMGTQEMTATTQAIDKSLQELANGWPLLGQPYEESVREESDRDRMS